MKTCYRVPVVLLIVSAAVCMPLLAGAQSSEVAFYADADRTSCAVAGDGSGIVNIYMFQLGSPSTAVQFAGYLPACWSGATWLGETMSEPFLQIDNTQSVRGLSVAYGYCRSGPIYLGYMTILGAPASECCTFGPSRPTNLAGNEPAGNALSVDCNFEFMPTGATPTTINESPSCKCQQPLSTRQSTWGAVKSLYN